MYRDLQNCYRLVYEQAHKAGTRTSIVITVSKTGEANVKEVSQSFITGSNSPVLTTTDPNVVIIGVASWLSKKVKSVSDIVDEIRPALDGGKRYQVYVESSYMGMSRLIIVIT